MLTLVPAEVTESLLVFPIQTEINTLHVCVLNPTDTMTLGALEALSGCHVAPKVSHELALVAALDQHYKAAIGHAAKRADEDGAQGRGRSGLRRAARGAVRAAARPGDLAHQPPARRAAPGPTRSQNLIREPAVIRLVHQMICRVRAGERERHPRRTARRSPAGPGSGRRGAADAVDAAGRRQPAGGRTAEGDGGPADRAEHRRRSTAGSATTSSGAARSTSVSRSCRRPPASAWCCGRSSARASAAASTSWASSPTCWNACRSSAELPNGILLVTGPTGSGKTTTLYALLDSLNSEDVCVLTAEDPVESRIDGTGQVPCDEARGVTFASALRSFLRQDPDVIMVGEIRDVETADIALKAALDRPSGAVDAAHQRRAGGDHPPDQHEPRAVRGRLGAPPGTGAAPDPPALPGLQGARRPAAVVDRGARARPRGAARQDRLQARRMLRTACKRGIAAASRFTRP